MRKLFPIAVVGAFLATTAVLANSPVAQATPPHSDALPLAEVVQLVEAKGYDVVEISHGKGDYEAVLRTGDGRLVAVRVDGQTARLYPSQRGDILRNILDQPK